METNNIFQGVITALITAFKDNKIDYIALNRIIQYQINHGIEALVLAGSTGEGMLLEEIEYQNLFQEVVNFAQNKIKIIAGNPYSCIDKSIRSINKIEQLKVDGLMVSIPPYLKPSQNGIYSYFKRLAESTNLPIMLYSNPSRTIVDFDYETIIKLVEIKNIIALKCSAADLERSTKLCAEFRDQNFNILAGDDALALPYYSTGAKGWVSVAANILPAKIKNIDQLIDQNQYAQARYEQFDLLSLYKILGNETNPVSVKWAMHYLGFCSNEIRLPLIEPSLITQEKLIKALMKLNIQL